MMSKIFRFFIIFPKITLFCLFLSTIFCAFYSQKLQIDASTESLMLKNDKGLEIWRKNAQTYKTKNFLIVAFTPKSKDIFDKDSILLIQKLQKEFQNLDFVSDVINITNVPLFENTKFSVDNPNFPTILSENIDLEKAKKEFKNSPLYSQNLVSKDLSTTGIVINLKPDLTYNKLLSKRNSLISTNSNELKIAEKELKIYRDSIRDKEHLQIKQIREILAKYNSQNELFLGGLNMISDDIVNFVKSDLATYGVATLMLLMLCLWIFFRQIRFVILPALICFVSVIFATGIFGFFEFEITIVSSNFIALQLIITMSVVIHLIVGYREKVNLRKSWSQKQIVFATLKDRINPCYYAIFTTVIGFLSLATCDILPIVMLGIMMSVAISFSLIVAFIVFASSMSLLKILQPKRNFENSFKFTQICANLAINHTNKIYIITAVLIVFGLFGMTKLKIENSFIGYFKESTEIYKGMAIIDQNLGGTIPFDVVIKFKESKQNTEILDDFEAEFVEEENSQKYWFNSQKIRIANKVGEFLKSQNFVGNVAGIDNFLKIGKILNDGKDLDDFTISVLFNNIPKDYQDIIINPYINIENNEIHFTARVKDSDKNLRRNQFLIDLDKNLNKLLQKDGVSVEVSGIMSLYNNVLQSLVSSQISSFSLVILALFLTFIYTFRSLKYAIIAIATNIAPLIIVFGIMGFLEIPLDIMSVTIASISIGIGVDNIIHYIYRYKIELRTKDKKAAIIASHGSIGYAMYFTSFAIFMGFGVMILSNFWPTIYFGVLTDLVMFLMLLATLILLACFILTFTKTAKS